MPRSLKPKGDGFSRLRRFANKHLGVIMTDDQAQSQQYRSEYLDILDKYYNNEQYDDLTDWETATAPDQTDFVPLRKRKPRIIYNLGKVMVDKVAAKLIGSQTFPTFSIESDDDDTAFFRTVLKASKFRPKMIDTIKHMLTSGASFARYFLVDGNIQIESFKSKYCYPTFDAIGELETIEIKYVYDDSADLDAKGEPKKKWFKIQLNKQSDILFDNPPYQPGGAKPTFNVVSETQHDLGWVQGEWFVTHDDKHDFDGYSIFGDILDFIDELNYSLSQSSQSNAYNQEPQLTVTKIDGDELEALVKSSTKAWNLGREGEAKYLETTGKGMQMANELRDKMRRFALDVSRVELQDPEKSAGVQSGEALKLLNAPLCELVDELRAVIEPKFVNLLIKIAMSCLHFNALGEETILETPPGYIPSSLDLTVAWPPIFPATLADISSAASAANQLSTSQIISRDSLTRWIAQMIPSIDNVEEELDKISKQEPLPSPFGTFGGGM